LRGTPSKRLITLQKRLESIFELLNSWQAYIEIIYMPDAEANFLLSQDFDTLNAKEISYEDRLKQEDTQTRLNTLFGDKDNVMGKMESMDSNNKESDAASVNYETVDEVQTSDTTEKKQSSRKSFEDL
jgi:hypothetical protein